MFKIGDRVKVISDYSGGKMLKNHVGTIVYIDRSTVCVEFDEYIDGHNGSVIDGLGKNGYCWWVALNHIVDISSTLKIPSGDFIVKSNDPRHSKIFIKEAHTKGKLIWSGGYNDELTYHDDMDCTIYYIVENGLISFAQKLNDLRHLDCPIYNIEDLFESGFVFDTTDDVERVLVNEPAIIVFTKDGYKGVAVCDNKDEFNHEIGYKIAYAKIERARATKKLKEIDKFLKSYL